MNIAYVAAVSATWASNPERGLYKAIDAEDPALSKFISDKAGFIDVVMDPGRNTLCGLVGHSAVHA
jgi:hypothetical protein